MRTQRARGGLRLFSPQRCMSLDRRSESSGNRPGFVQAPTVLRSSQQIAVMTSWANRSLGVIASIPFRVAESGAQRTRVAVVEIIGALRRIHQTLNNCQRRLCAHLATGLISRIPLRCHNSIPIAIPKCSRQRRCVRINQIVSPFVRHWISEPKCDHLRHQMIARGTFELN
jgi:hypothetical protein